MYYQIKIHAYNYTHKNRPSRAGFLRAGKQIPSHLCFIHCQVQVTESRTPSVDNVLDHTIKLPCDHYLPLLQVSFLPSSVPHVGLKAFEVDRLRNRWSSLCIPSRQIQINDPMTHSNKKTKHVKVHLKYLEREKAAKLKLQFLSYR